MIYTEAELPIDRYHARPHLSHSKLRDFDAYGPYGYKLMHIDRVRKRECTKAMAFGLALEDELCSALYGRTPASTEYVFKPAGLDGRTKEGKAWLAQNEGKVDLSAQDKETIAMLVQTIMRDEHIASVLRECTPQPTYDSPERDIFLAQQARPDFVHPEGCTIDLKSCASLADVASGRDIANHGYHSQGAFAHSCMQANGVRVHTHKLLACEKVFPFRVQLIKVDSAFLAAGLRWCSSVSGRILRCKLADRWPLVEHAEVVACAPKWVDSEEW